MRRGRLCRIIKMEGTDPSGKVGQICPQILVLASSDANPAQCLSAGTLRPDLIAEAVDLATPLASIILEKGIR